MVRVAVIGSGIAGLAAASHLVDNGYQVTMYESDGHVGGHACTQQVKYGQPSPSPAPSTAAPSTPTPPRSTPNGEVKRNGHRKGEAPSTPSSQSSSTTASTNEMEYGADIGFQVFNQVTYPNMLNWFEKYGVGLEKSDMSLAVAMPVCHCQVNNTYLHH
jgi:predicted NAD/FAD-binding protein